MRAALISILVISGLITQVSAAQLTRIDSVTVDSVWNTDTSIDGNPYVHRDLILSFIPIADDTVSCVVDISGDSGKTWGANRSFCEGIDSIALFRAAPNTKKSIHLRVFVGDTSNIIFRVTGRSDTTKLSQFRLKTSVDGWLENDSSYYYYKNWRELAQKIDGYYMPYIFNGMADGITDKIIKQDTLSCTQFIMDFGTITRAGNVYAEKKPQNFSVALDFPDSLAIGKRALGGLMVYAHFRHSYFEMNFAGYPIQDSAVAHANTLLKYYQQKAGM
jgi:hypothetical protein